VEGDKEVDDLVEETCQSLQARLSGCTKSKPQRIYDAIDLKLIILLDGFFKSVE
jgi:hypothetical protein